MELSEAVRILADYAEALPHTPPAISGGKQDPVPVGFLSFEDALSMKKALVVAAGALKSIQDCFGLPADMVMVSIKTAIEGMGELVEQAGIFDRMHESKTGGQVIELMPPPHGGA